MAEALDTCQHSALQVFKPTIGRLNVQHGMRIGWCEAL